MRKRRAGSQTPQTLSDSKTSSQTLSDDKKVVMPVFRFSDLFAKMLILSSYFSVLMIVELIVVAGRPSVESMVDKPFQWCLSLNQWFHQQEQAGNTLPASCLLMADTLLLGLCAALTTFFILSTPVVRCGTAMILNHSLRAICMIIVELPEPSKILWRKPGFPSEGKNDYFFSGHMALVLITAFELWHRGYHKASLVMHVLNIGQCFIFLVLQLHYTVDIVCGLFSGFFCFYIVDFNLDIVHRMMYGLIIIIKYIIRVDKLDFSPAMYKKLYIPMMSDSKAALVSATVTIGAIIVMFVFDCF